MSQAWKIKSQGITPEGARADPALLLREPASWRSLLGYQCWFLTCFVRSGIKHLHVGDASSLPGRFPGAVSPFHSLPSLSPLPRTPVPAPTSCAMSLTLIFHLPATSNLLFLIRAEKERFSCLVKIQIKKTKIFIGLKSKNLVFIDLSKGKQHRHRLVPSARLCRSLRLSSCHFLLCLAYFQKHKPVLSGKTRKFSFSEYQNKTLLANSKAHIPPNIWN